MPARRAGRKGDATAASKARPKSKQGQQGNTKRRKEQREFVSEAEEILERMAEDLSDLQDQRGGDREVDPDLVNRIFRSAHSLKGLAGMFGLEAIGELAHHLEDILDGLRLGRIPTDSPAVALLDDGLALLGSMMNETQDAGVTGSEDLEAVRAFVARIDEAVRAPAAEAPDELEGLSIDPSLLRALTEYEEHRLRENLRRGRSIAMVESNFEIAMFEEGLSELSSAVREVGEVISTLPSPGDAPESQLRFSLLVASELSPEQLCARLDLPGSDVHGVPSRDGEPQRSSEEIRETPVSGVQGMDVGQDRLESPSANVGGGLVDRPGAAPSAEPTATGAHPDLDSLRSMGDTVRVDIRKLDELMNLVGELVIQRNAIASVAQRLMADPQTAKIGSDLVKTHKALDRKLKDLQSGVLDVRMVPLRQIFEKLSRVVRRLRRDLDKEVVFDVEGSDTELDKLIVEKLVDPLVHIVRNAFDHAIEPAEDRRRAGKPSQGRISIRGIQRGNHVVIEVEDDGRGLDIEAIREKALARGLIGPEETLSNRELLALVFEPGFSTRAEVSETSGRGVGMDVVRSNVEEMGGSVDVSTREGRGSTVTITLPITLAIVQALMVGVGRECFAIPLSSVLETLVVDPGQIGRSEGREILNLRGEPLLLRRLGEEFEIESMGRDERQFVVVLAMGEQRLGLLVDRLEGQQDAVIKPIQGPVQQIRGIAGATELGDRGAILVIDVSSILGDALRRREAA